jgi:pimeloyl-ACP methyl ester carboxylesterase
VRTKRPLPAAPIQGTVGSGPARQDPRRPPGAPRPIVFSHANGFPAGTYRVLFDRWRAAGHDVHAIERFGHDPRFPVTSNWRGLRDQLIEFIEHQRVGQVALVGHSLGGLLSLLAACKRPDLAAALVMIDSPVVTGWRAHSLSVLKRTGLMPRVSPGKVSKQRRHQWPDRASVLAHFQAKPAFARWDPRVLRDYVAAGFDDHGDHVELGFHREVETRIYNTLPHHMGAVLKRHPPRCLVAFLAGTQSVELRQGGAAGARGLAQQRFRWIEGSHLFPMERPDETADAVLAALADEVAASAGPL